ncbi:neuropeptide FF receptor 1-like [Orbicella faveolata]|uniref:neuropeptide FF receptor 1-like n=1 Tax=Orbicella faveolata TaxID=48498 RepID=UPI0009E3C020|nr:neuropeptide FF receptor 1-like [Orbicella faveolata]
MTNSASNIASAGIVGVATIVAIVGNVLVAYVLTKRRKVLLKNHPTYQFILNLVLSDLVVGILLCPFKFIRRLFGTWIFGTSLCKVIAFVQISASGTAVMFHALIAVDRYRCLAHPHLPKLKPRLVRQLIALSWGVPALVATPYLYMLQVVQFNFYQMCTPLSIPLPWLDKLYEAVEFGAAHLFPFCVICGCYYHVIKIALGRQPPVSGSAHGATAQIALRRSRRRVTKTACLIMVAFIICWSPTFVLSIWRIASGTESVHHSHTLYEVSFFGTLINKAINPIIYGVYDRNINVCAHIYCGHRIFNATASEAESTGTKSNDTTHNRGSTKSTRRLKFNEPP